MNKVLLVDDEPHLLKNLAALLGDQNPDWLIFQSASAADALNKIESEEFDLVIADWRFDKESLTGTDILRALKKRSPFTMCIIITAFQGDKMDRYQDAFRHGAYDVIDKKDPRIEFCPELRYKAESALAFRFESQKRQAESRARDSFARHLDANVVRAYDSPKILDFEPKWLTILFCDVRGFSRISAQLIDQNQIVAEFLRELYSKIDAIAHKHQGIVDKFIGDGAMLLFGATRPASASIYDHETDAQQAVSAALELQREGSKIIGNLKNAFRKVNTAKWEGLTLGIGINTAKVLVGLIKMENRDQFSALGNGVNLAKHFESAAGRRASSGRVRGAVLISQTVKERLNGRFKLVTNGTLENSEKFDGKQPIWSVLGRKDDTNKSTP